MWLAHLCATVLCVLRVHSHLNICNIIHTSRQEFWCKWALRKMDRHRTSIQVEADGAKLHFYMKVWVCIQHISICQYIWIFLFLHTVSFEVIICVMSNVQILHNVFVFSYKICLIKLKAKFTSLKKILNAHIYIIFFSGTCRSLDHGAISGS